MTVAIATVRFTEIRDKVPATPGIYEIYTDTGTPLKVGIGTNLQRRLLQHRASRQSGLRLRAGGDWSEPRDVASKASILSKHLYFDRSLTAQHDLTSQAGRRTFLEERCYIKYEATKTADQARDLERLREQQKLFRYSNEVRIR